MCVHLYVYIYIYMISIAISGSRRLRASSLWWSLYSNHSTDRRCMLALYQASVNYIVAEQGILGAHHDGLSASQNARVAHFISSMASMARDVTDSQAALSEIAKETPAFTRDQKVNIVKAIANHMQGKDVPTSTSTTTAKVQKHVHQQNYLTEAVWSMLMSKDVTWEEKQERLIDHLIHKLGLRNPDDATVKNTLALVQAGHGRQMSPQEAYSQVNSIKDKFNNKREDMPGSQKMRTYPADVNDFMRLHPGSFLQCEPPVTSRLDDLRLRQLTRRDVMPTRSSNKYIRQPTARTAVAAGSSGPSQGQDSNSQLANIALQWILGGNRPATGHREQGCAHHREHLQRLGRQP